MKIGGLTWWRNNYGSILQAYAMQMALSSFEEVDYEILCQYGKKITSIDNLVNKIKKIGLKNTLKRAFWKFFFPGLKQRNYNIQRFVDEKLNVSEKQYSEELISQANEDYDGFICGSDQIWNPTLTPVDSIYWLGFATNNKLKFSYAPSIGVDSVTEEEAEKIRQNLATFQVITCREESGTELLNQIMGVERCVTVLDPTLIVERSVWDDLCLPRQFKEPYIFAYILRGNIEQRKLIAAFAKERNLKVVTIPFLETEHINLYDFSFGDIKYWDAAPDGFISAIRNADYVFTDSFHCIVFSCLYHTQFFVFPKVGVAQMNRLTGLQELLHTGNRMITEKQSVFDLKNIKQIDWSKVEVSLQEKRKTSLYYLNKALIEK
ncbi:polysaccharide pyruvyl transferase family protein [Lacrimispora sp.]|uniref:polysaccharide pyruvyl transferase family protein n=1 Tax=Lacrimispora sp. TaxID=2719234 RepID=UPI0028AA42A0|nr:polysaccharide pyruvyl transferase family protein [Lacrimispora sp.]